MPYLTPQGEEILTPEEQAARDAAMASVVTGAGGGNAPIPPPPQQGPPVPAATGMDAYPSDSAGMYAAPVEQQYLPGGTEYLPTYDQYVPPAAAPAQTTDSVPPPTSGSGSSPLPNDNTIYDSRQYVGRLTPLPTPTPSSPTINARASDYTALGPDPTEYLRRTYGPSPSGQGGTGLDSDRTAPGWTPGPKHPTFVDPAKYTPINQAWGRQDDSRAAPPIPPPPTPTNWWDGLTDAAGNVIPGLVQWATPGLASGPANSTRQAQDAVGGVLRDASLPPVRQASLDQLNQGLGLTQPDTGISWRDVLSPGDWIPEPQTYRDSSGREMLGVGDAMFLPDPMGGVGTAGFADDAARVMNSADDAARVANTVDDAARMRTTATGDIPEPPTGQPLAEPEPVVDTAGSTTGVSNAAPVSGSTVPSGTQPRSSRLPRLTGKKLAAAGLATVGAAGLINNVIQTGQPGGANQPPGGSTPTNGAQRPPLEPGIYSGSTNPSTPDQWAGATTRSLQLMTEYPESNKDWYTKTQTKPIMDADGVWRTGIAVKGLADSAGNPFYVGFVDANNTIVPAGVDFPNLREALRDALPSDPPADATATGPSQGGTASGTTVSDAAIPTPDSGSSSSGSSGKRSGDWNNDWSGSRSSRGSSRSKDYGSDGDGYDQEFTAEDFMEAANGDRKKARMMAQIANKRRRGKRKGGTASDTTSGFWDGFPFNRPPTPIREHVLTALQESMARGRK